MFGPTLSGSDARAGGFCAVGCRIALILLAWGPFALWAQQPPAPQALPGVLVHRKNHLNGAGAEPQHDSYRGFDPLDWSVDMVELPRADYLLQDRYRVHIPAFRMARFQVTRQLYHMVMRLPRPSRPYEPVVGVSWFDAVRFANELSRMAGLEPVYRIRRLSYSPDQQNQQIQRDLAVRQTVATEGREGRELMRYRIRYEVEWLDDRNGYRLPTEAEWEYAARARRFRYSGSNTLENVAWYDGNTRSLQQIGLKEPNSIGLYDMSGNAWDWLWDRYIPLENSPLARRGSPPPESLSSRFVGRGGNGPWAATSRIWLGPSIYEEAGEGAYDAKPLPANPAALTSAEPLVRGFDLSELAKTRGLSDAELRVCRGGGWNFAAVYSEVLQRSPCIAQADYYISVGFRLARSLLETVETDRGGEMTAASRTNAGSQQSRE